MFVLFICLPCCGQAPIYTAWKNYTVADGIPDEKVLCVAVDGDRVWAGTRNGVVLLENGKMIRVFKTEDGLANNAVTAIAIDRVTDDVWMATLGGLSRYSGGEFRNYTSLESGLANDIVYSVAIQNEYVWAATAAGISRLDTHTGEWSMYDDENLPGPASPADSIAVTKSKIYFGSWGGGVLEYDIATEHWNSYSPSDVSAETRAHPPVRGPLSAFITGISYDGNTLWASSRFGLSSYDGRWWRRVAPPAEKLASIAVNTVRSDAHGVWVCSDAGLLYLDRSTGAWVVYRTDPQSYGVIAWTRPGAKLEKVKAATGLASNEVLDIASSNQSVWVATASGLSHGTRLCTSAKCMSQQSSYVPTAAQSHFEKQSGAPRTETISAQDTVNIGILSPADNSPESIYGMSMLQGAQLAIEEANADGGFAAGSKNRKPFALRIHTDSPLWGASTTEIVKMTNDEHVFGVLGSVDGASSHTMLKVASILDVPIVNSATSDPDITSTGLPWVLHNFPDNRNEAHALARYAVANLGSKRIGVLCMKTRDSIAAVHEFAKIAARLGPARIVETRFERGDKDFSPQLRKLADAEVDVVLLWGEPRQAALILKQMRAIGMQQPVLGPSRAGDASLIQSAGVAAEGLVVASAINPASTNLRWQEFTINYRRRFSAIPDAYACYGYDGAKLLISAIQKAGLDRRAIRDALREYANKDYLGANGASHFNAELNNISPVVLARVEGGRFVYWHPAGNSSRH